MWIHFYSDYTNGFQSSFEACLVNEYQVISGVVAYAKAEPCIETSLYTVNYERQLRLYGHVARLAAGDLPSIRGSE